MLLQRYVKERGTVKTVPVALKEIETLKEDTPKVTKKRTTVKKKEG
nr:MAG TPA: hypothetical protein [Caudoviricetes sp.]